MTQTAAHTISVQIKQGSEWTNDLGQTFPAAPLHRCVCSCGWKGMAWFNGRDKAIAVAKRHLAAT